MDELPTLPQYTVTLTALPDADPLAALPDDERRLVLAWRRARAESKNGIAALFAVKVFREVLLFVGSQAGKVLLR